MTKETKAQVLENIDLLAETKRKLGETRAQRESCQRDIREVHNALIGLNPAGHAPRDTIHASEVADLQEKQRKLRAQSSEFAERIAYLEKQVADLAAMEPPEETLLEIAIDQYKLAVPALKELQDLQRDLAGKHQGALDKKSQAESAVRAAEAKKRNALSHEEMSAANRELTEAGQQLDDVLALTANIEKAQNELPARIALATEKIRNAEQDVWTAQFNYLTARLRNDEAFSKVKDLIDSAFAAKIKAGGADFARVVSTLMGPNPDPDQIAQVQKEMAFGLGLV